jgi:hypothetical protein
MMARLPLTVYLPHADLARLATLARRAGVARSAFAGDAIRAKLIDAPGESIGQDGQLNFVSAAVEELISIHPDSEAIRSRLAQRFAFPNQPNSEGNFPCPNS